MNTKMRTCYILIYQEDAIIQTMSSRHQFCTQSQFLSIRKSKLMCLSICKMKLVILFFLFFFLMKVTWLIVYRRGNYFIDSMLPYGRSRFQDYKFFYHKFLYEPLTKIIYRVIIWYFRITINAYSTFYITVSPTN